MTHCPSCKRTERKYPGDCIDTWHSNSSTVNTKGPPLVIFETLKMPCYDPLIDDDIKAMFEGKGGYFAEAVLIAQLIKEMQLARGRVTAGAQHE